MEKFTKKVLSEDGIKIGKPAASEAAAIEKHAAAAGVGEGRKPVSADSGDDEKEFQVTIKIKMSTKRKLDELKYIHRRSFKELAEEAFADLYVKLKAD